MVNGVLMELQVTSDDGTEYTTGKTTNGTAGSSGAYVQYDLSARLLVYLVNLYYYEGTGTAGNSGATMVVQIDYQLHQDAFSYDSVICL